MFYYVLVCSYCQKREPPTTRRSSTRVVDEGRNRIGHCEQGIRSDSTFRAGIPNCELKKVSLAWPSFQGPVFTTCPGDREEGKCQGE